MPARIILFVAPGWSGPCREAVARLREEGLEAEVVDIDEHPERAAMYGLRGVPAVVTLGEGGEVRGIAMGLPPKGKPLLATI